MSDNWVGDICDYEAYLNYRRGLRKAHFYIWHDFRAEGYW